MAHKLIRSLQRVASRFFRAPFEHLPAEYGNTVPPELGLFEAEAEARRPDTVEKIALPETRHPRSRPARRDESLERE
jgi:hypothetical protein